MEKIHIQDTITTTDTACDFYTKEEADYVNSQEGKNVIATVHRKLIKADGTEMFEFIGGNATVLGGTQLIVQNTFAGITNSMLTQIDTLDKDPSLNITPVSKYLDDVKRIFGFGVGMDGGINNTVYPIKRHTKGYETSKLFAFKTLIADPLVDDVVENVKKYTLRSVDTSTNTSLYYIKKVSPILSNVTIHGETVPNHPTANYSGKFDIRSKVTLNLRIEEDELTDWYGYKFGTKDGAIMNSIILFAGRNCESIINGTTVNTYRDVVATNKINVVSIPLNNTSIDFIYTLYYV
jgi:hypothetical protein